MCSLKYKARYLHSVWVDGDERTSLDVQAMSGGSVVDKARRRARIPSGDQGLHGSEGSTGHIRYGTTDLPLLRDDHKEWIS
jgi:hypothetical protein